MKMRLFLLFLISIIFISCDFGFEPESEKQTYYTPTVEQMKTYIFKEHGTTWSVSFYSYYSTGTKEHQWQQSNKGSGYKYSFYSDLTYSYRSWENKYEYVWAPEMKANYSGKVDILDGKIIFYDLFGESKLEKTVQLSDNNKWIKIGDSAYHL